MVEDEDDEDWELQYVEYVPLNEGATGKILI